MSKKILIILIPLCCIFQSKAQDYNFKHYGQKQGLSNLNVKCIYQDSFGYIWFATQGGGINKFDGKTFTNYDKQDGLVGNDVICITEDKNKNIWIGTIDGVSKFNRKTFTNYTTENGLKDNKVYGILCDEQKIWFSTYGGGIAILENNKFSYLNTSNGLSSDKVFSVFKDNKNTYWIGTSKGGINIYNGKSVTVVKENKGFNSASAFCFYEGRDKKIWIGTPGKGVFYIENNSIHQFDFPLINSDYISKIIEDKQGNIWCATEHGLLKIFKNLSFKIFNNENGLIGNDISSLLCDYEGEIWVSSFGNGVFKLTNEAFSVFTKQHGLLENRVVALCKYKKGLLISTTSGLNSNIDGIIEKVSLPKDLEGKLILSLLFENKKLYVGTQSNGFYILNETSKNVFAIDENIKNVDSIEIKTEITCIQKNNLSNTVWLSVYGAGIIKIQDDKTEIYCKENGKLITNDVISIQLIKNDLWIGTIGEGLIKLNTLTNEFKNYSKSHGISSKSIFVLNEYKGQIIAGTSDEGLFILNNNHFININKKNGLLSNAINSIQQTKSNELWIGSDLGINKIVLNQNLTLKNIKVYTDEDGLKTSAIEQNASIEQDGFLYFGTGEGLVKYNAAEDIVSDAKPHILISELLLKYMPIDTTKIKYKSLSMDNLPIEPVFSYKQNDITFKFKALSTQTSNFQFMIEGYDKNWSPVTSTSEAVFTNLPPGIYTFKVKAINKYHIDSDIIEYTFEITPPFYMRWWFFVLSFFIIAISIYSFIKYRTRKLITEKLALENKVTERTVELKTANSSLNSAIEEITDSINYAQRIQRSILPNIDFIKEQLPNSFVYFKPRDVVSGDFYWFNKLDNHLFFATVDCTGHGVPGAFMSMIGNSLLNEIILTQKIISPSDILSNLNQSIIKVLKQSTTESRDGMDIAVCKINLLNNTLTYAGANRELLLIRDSSLIVFKPTKSAIGGLTDANTIFNETVLEFQRNDVFYMSTDGYADQFGGEKGKKLMTKNFKEFLVSIHHLSIKDQQIELDLKLKNWMGTYDQVDDVLVVGIKL